MWNNANQGYPGNYPQAPPPQFPSPGGFGNPPPVPYPQGNAAYPPPGPPGTSPGGYLPPPGPPPHGFGPPAGPPPYISPPPFPPPQHQPPPSQPSTYPGQQYHQQQYHSPPPVPPPIRHGSSGYPAQQQQPPPQGYGNYRPPPGPPGPPSYAPPPTGPPPPPPTQQQFYGPQGANGQGQPFFQYSQCNGKKKALCIGINYAGQSAELKGCINDARNIQNFIMNRFQYKADDIVMLTDDARNPRQMPTKDNIIHAMQWLVRGAQPNDSLFFHFSGHGGQTKDLDGDEEDGFDEVIYPVDFETNGHIEDDMMHDIMVKPLPPGCRMTAIFDSCHSGSALDLPYIYSTEGKIKEPNLAAEAGQGLLTAVTSYARGDMGGVFSSVSGLLKTATGSGQKAGAYAKATRTSPADVIMWSGCKDSQTSADTSEAGQATGAMSYAFTTSLNQNPQQSYMQLLNSIREILRNKYSQKPQLSCSHPIDTNILFIA